MDKRFFSFFEFFQTNSALKGFWHLLCGSGGAYLLGLLKNIPSLITDQMQIDDLTLCNSRSLDESSGTREIYHDLRVLTKVRPAGDAPDHG